MCVVSIAYDRDIPGEDERAMACYNEVANRMLPRYEFYRLGVHSMRDFRAAPATVDVLSRIKDVLDPAHLLAPGRYQPYPG
jgi:4-cresol dehydrogenase (hydroxylating)